MFGRVSTAVKRTDSEISQATLHIDGLFRPCLRCVLVFLCLLRAFSRRCGSLPLRHFFVLDSCTPGPFCNHRHGPGFGEAAAAAACTPPREMSPRLAVTVGLSRSELARGSPWHWNCDARSGQARDPGGVKRTQRTWLASAQAQVRSASFPTACQ